MRKNKEEFEEEGLTAFQKAQRHFKKLDSESSTPTSSLSRATSLQNIQQQDQKHQASPPQNIPTADSLANGLVAARISQWVQFEEPSTATAPVITTAAPIATTQQQQTSREPINPFDSPPIVVTSRNINPFADSTFPAVSNPFEDEQARWEDDESSSDDDYLEIQRKPLVPPSQNSPNFSRPTSRPVTPGKPALPPRPASIRPSVAPDQTSPAKPPLPARPTKIPGVNISSTNVTLQQVARTLSHDKSIVYPETFNANRKAPFASGCKCEINVKGPVFCIASSRGHIVTGSIGGFKIWNTQDGECVYSSGKGGEIKVSALCFLPSHIREFDGRFCWVGFSDGDLWMVDIFTGTVLERRVSAHNHRVLHILRFKYFMITIDENGIMQVWSEIHSATAPTPLFSVSTGPDKSVHVGAVVTLEGKSRTLRIASNQESACVVEQYVWTCKDRTIEVVAPLDDSSSVFKGKIEIPANVGPVSCMGAIYKNSPLPGLLSDLLIPASQWVYTGHTDGKIIEWDAQTLSKRRVFDTGSYRIVSLFGVSPKLLWVCVGTGKILVFDVHSVPVGNIQTSPTSITKYHDNVTVVKEWQAEVKDTVEAISVDVDSILHSGQIIVAGSTKAGHVQIWDALFPGDYIEMQIREAQYCEYEKMQLLICSWNIDANKPENLLARADDAYFLDKWVTTIPEGADMIVFGFQEIIDLESKSIAAKGIWKKKATKEAQQQADHESRARAWRERLARAMKDNYKHTYIMLDSRNLVGLFTCIFVRDNIANRVSNVESATVSTGMGGAYGNKGAIVTRLCFDATSFCFLTAHLPAHQNKVGKRNVDAWTILRAQGLSELPESDLRSLWTVRGGDGSQVLDHENVFFFGDLNYRIDLEREQCISCIEQGDLNTLLQHDQLIKQRTSANSTCLLRLFEEPFIKFMPTYKYDPGTDTYDSSEKKRVPAYCDRILYRDSISQTSMCLIDTTQRNLPLSQITPLAYKRFECKISDHRPIACAFEVITKRLTDTKRRSSKYVAVENDLNKRKQEYMWDASVRWLMERGGSSRQLTENILKQCQGDISAAINMIRNFTQK